MFFMSMGVASVNMVSLKDADGAEEEEEEPERIGSFVNGFAKFGPQDIFGEV